MAGVLLYSSWLHGGVALFFLSSRGARTRSRHAPQQQINVRAPLRIGLGEIEFMSAHVKKSHGIIFIGVHASTVAQHVQGRSRMEITPRLLAWPSLLASTGRTWDDAPARGPTATKLYTPGRPARRMLPNTMIVTTYPMHAWPFGVNTNHINGAVLTSCHGQAHLALVAGPSTGWQSYHHPMVHCACQR